MRDLFGKRRLWRSFAGTLTLNCLAGLATGSPSLSGETVKVHASQTVSCGSSNPAVLREIIRQLRGDVQIRTDGCAVVGLFVDRVIAGKAVDPSFAKRPLGINALQVYVINDAAAGSGGGGGSSLRSHDEAQKFAGVWTLHALSGGEFVVSDLADTPLPSEIADQRRRKNSEIERNLKSLDPEAQYDALVAWRNAGGPFLDIPLIIRLIDSDYKIPQAFGAVTLGEFARQQLVWSIGLIEGKSRLGLYDAADDYQKWWDGVLNDAPRPAEPAVSGRTRSLVELTLNQRYYPNIATSPDGRLLLLGISRMQVPLDGVVNGIVAASYDSVPTVRQVYTVASNTQGNEPDRLAVAWTDDAGALVWLDRWFDQRDSDLKFAAINRRGDISVAAEDLGIPDSVWAVLAPSESGWTLVYSSRQGKDVVLQKIGRTGKQSDAASRFSLPVDTTVYGNDWTGVVEAFTVGEKTKVFAVTGSAARDVFLVTFDKDLRPSGVKRITSPGKADTYFAPIRAAWDGHEFCIEWLDMVNGHADLAISFLDAEGVPIGKPVALTHSFQDGGTRYPAPLASRGGFLVAWAERPGLMRELKVAFVDPQHDAVRSKTVLSTKAETTSFAIGAEGAKVRIIAIDYSSYPQKVLLKEMNRTNWD